MNYSRDDIIGMLRSEDAEKESLFKKADEVKRATIGDGVYLRGLIEYSNVCGKNCYYCGIRRDQDIERYTLSDDQVFEAAEKAYGAGYGSIVLQGGEISSVKHTAKIASLLKGIKELSNGELGITLSLGEQTPETYSRWREAGASRYLLRIEASNRDLYSKIHPKDQVHDFDKRLRALEDLRAAGYMVGTGVMIGLPFQKIEDLADDLLFMRGLDIDMCGMGPYIVSKGTPLAECGKTLRPERWRLEMTLKMIAVLRLLMPDINIAATTALQAIDANGRVRAIEAGANVIMPNMTPDDMKGNYALYDNKPMSLDTRILEQNIRYSEKGDPHHFKNRIDK